MPETPRLSAEAGALITLLNTKRNFGTVVLSDVRCAEVITVLRDYQEVVARLPALRAELARRWKEAGSQYLDACCEVLNCPLCGHELKRASDRATHEHYQDCPVPLLDQIVKEEG